MENKSEIEKMKNKHNLGEIILEGNRIFIQHETRHSKNKIDVTPVWHFFKDVMDFKNRTEITHEQQ